MDSVGVELPAEIATGYITLLCFDPARCYIRAIMLRGELQMEIKQPGSGQDT